MIFQNNMKNYSEYAIKQQINELSKPPIKQKTQKERKTRNNSKTK